MEVLQKTEAPRKALSCKIQSSAKTTAIPMPCQNKPPCESEPVAAKRRAGPGDAGMGKGWPCRRSCWSASFQKARALGRRRMSRSSLWLFRQKGENFQCLCVPRDLGCHHQAGAHAAGRGGRAGGRRREREAERRRKWCRVLLLCQKNEKEL